MPQWDLRNLQRHHKKHHGCFESILGMPININAYSNEATKIMGRSWAEYEAQAWEKNKRQYTPTRSYYVDSDLCLAITDSDKENFITCFHEHFGQPRKCATYQTLSSGEKIMKFRTHFDREEQGKMIRNVKRLKGV